MRQECEEENARRALENVENESSSALPLRILPRCFLVFGKQSHEDPKARQRDRRRSLHFEHHRSEPVRAFGLRTPTAIQIRIFRLLPRVVTLQQRLPLYAQGVCRRYRLVPIFLRRCFTTCSLFPIDEGDDLGI